jgi:transketolase
MGEILNGILLHGSVRVYGGTSLLLSDYLRPTIRLAALMRLPTIFLLLDDSFYIGEDGPTYQPVEHLMALRNIPDLNVIRPADANETVAAWQIALSQRDTPTAIILARQVLPVIEETAQKARGGVPRGAYVLRDSPLERIDLVLIATGSEVHDALEAQVLLHKRHIGARVVSMPSWRLYDEQPLFYKLSIMPDNVSKRLAIEAGSTLGWERYVGSYGAIIGLDRFGASGSAAVLKEAFGFTPEAIAKRAIDLMSE